MLGFALVVSGAVLAATPPSTVEQDQASYRAAATAAGRDSAAHVRLALWCEAHGLTAERQKHLAIAILTDPANTVARGLMGLVREGTSWRRPEDVAKSVETDAQLQASLAEYNARRDKTPASADAQWKLALWCEEHGLKAEAKAHLAAVVRLNPGNETAWKRLGYQKKGNRWWTREQIEAARADHDAQTKADRHWRPLLQDARADLSDPKKREAAEAVLGKVDDPRALPSVLRVFARPAPADQERAVQILGQIDCAASSRALAVFAATGATEQIRRSASETLRHRDPREYVGFLVGRLDDPTPFEVGVIADGDRLYRVLLQEESDRYVVNVYNIPLQIQRNFDTTSFGRLAPSNTQASPYLPGVLTAGWGADQSSQNALAMYEANLQATRQAEIDRQARQAAPIEETVTRDAQALAQRNALIEARNAAVYTALARTTGLTLPNDREAWTAWYMDALGYRYEPPKKGIKPYVFASRGPDAIASQSYECFAAGTPVQTLTGQQPIESLKVGDRVLAQDTRTGMLTYKPILNVYRNPPAETIRLTIDGEEIVPSTLHRFWKAGQGWALARELKPGDKLRTFRGPAVIQSIRADKVQPVFNLDVDDSATFFVGKTGALVHDNRLPELRDKGFDALPDLTVAK